MKKQLYPVHKILTMIGINAQQFVHSLRGLPLFWKDYRTLSKQQSDGQHIPFGKMFPCLGDRFESSGVASGHYFHQDLLVAQKIYENKPELHVDIGSRVDGFVAHVATFREIEVFDVRHLTTEWGNIKFRQQNFMASDNPYTDYCDSISSLHAIEHFGLGRYGDPIDVDGHLRGLENIYKMLKRGGKFYLSVPIGDLRIEFNGHRVFSINYMLNLIGSKYKIDTFSYVNDQGRLVKDVPLSEEGIAGNFGCTYGCGIFELTKL